MVLRSDPVSVTTAHCEWQWLHLTPTLSHIVIDGDASNVQNLSEDIPLTSIHCLGSEQLCSSACMSHAMARKINVVYGHIGWLHGDFSGSRSGLVVYAPLVMPDYVG